jgi:hypothetical protein
MNKRIFEDEYGRMWTVSKFGSSLWGEVRESKLWVVKIIMGPKKTR